MAEVTDRCGSYLSYQSLIECGETRSAAEKQGHPIDNLPKRVETFAAMHDLRVKILDPVIDHFGPIELTYGFASTALNKAVHQNKSRPPNVTFTGDQHAGCELNRNGKPFCSRLGQSVDFYVPGKGSFEVARWVVENTPFDRLYFYADNRPFHVSFGPEHSRLAWRLPRAVSDQIRSSFYRHCRACPGNHGPAEQVRG